MATDQQRAEAMADLLATRDRLKALVKQMGEMDAYTVRGRMESLVHQAKQHLDTLNATAAFLTGDFR